MKKIISNPIPAIIGIYMVCTIVKYIEFLWIRTDQTILADNVFCKIFCIAILFVCLKKLGIRWSDIGFVRWGIGKSILSGFALGFITFGISYSLEILFLKMQGLDASLQFFVTNFALTGASTILTASLPAILICIMGNIINVWAEEGLFRGLFLKLGKSKYTFQTANAIQAFLFGTWHIVTVVLAVRDGSMSLGVAVVMSIGYVVLAGILGLEWGLCVSISGGIWVGVAEHFFNNFVSNTIHVVTAHGIDEFQIPRIILSNVLSLTIVLLVGKYRQKHSPSTSLPSAT